MPTKKLSADYLIIGSGAMGMAFADVLVAESEVSIIIVDKYPKPGGHWNVAYPFVTLHQPSAFYGVSSRALGSTKIDTEGLNKGLHELATGKEVLDYFSQVMDETFLTSGQVQYFPEHEYVGDHKFVSMDDGQVYEVEVKRKIVDATYLKTAVPATHTPNFTINPEVNFIPINDLPTIVSNPDRYVIIGGGKTGIDACLRLLENEVDPDKISWIVSRDAWLIDRITTQPSMDFFKEFMGTLGSQFESLAESTSIDDLFVRLEESGVLVRIDKSVKPRMFHGATVSQLELEALRKIKQVIRLGRLRSIEQDKMVFDEGEVSSSTNWVFVDCSASAVTNLVITDVFKDHIITPQTVRSYQPTFSAAFIAHVELNYTDNEKKNELCKVVPLPDNDTSWLRMLAVFMQNQFTWSQDKGLKKWLYNNRLDGFSKLVADRPRDNQEYEALVKRMREKTFKAVMKLQGYIQELDA